MNKMLFLLLSMYCMQAVGQTYSLDDSFANHGVLKLDFYPREAFLSSMQIGEYYYFNSGYEMTRINADGSDALTFAMAGGKMLNFKFINNSLYMVGYNYINGSDNYNAQIIKTDLAGNPDPDFGDNGSKIIDFGGNDRLRDIVMTSDGNLLCGGQRGTTNECTQITFKINPATGAIIPNADNTEYREYHCNIPNAFPLLAESFLYSYENGYLLMGWMQGRLSIINIDENGVVNTAFGTNGYKSVMDLGETLDHISVVDNKVYCTSQTGDWVQYNKLMCYDLATDQVIFNNDNGPDGVCSFLVAPEGIYTTAISNTLDSNGPATEKFILRRKYFNGGMDSSFNNTGSFTYDSPTVVATDYQDEAQTILKLANGDFFLGGYTRWNTGSNNFFGRTIIKIKAQVLSVNSQTKAQVSLSPNPFQDKLSLTYDAPINDITIYDLSGRIILKPQFESGKQITIDVSEIMQKGIYLMELATDDGSFARKIIKG